VWESVFDCMQRTYIVGTVDLTPGPDGPGDTYPQCMTCSVGLKSPWGQETPTQRILIYVSMHTV